MVLAEVSATGDATRVGYNFPDRRPSHEPPQPLEPPTPPAAEPAEQHSVDVAFHANRFRADLSQLGAPAEPYEHEPGASDAQGDPALFDFFGNLNVLLLAVRAGDLARARAAASALEMEVLVERSAGRAGEPVSGRRLEDFGRLFGPHPKREATTLGPVLTAAPAPPDPYGELGADEGAAAEDAAAAYFDAQARV